MENGNELKLILALLSKGHVEAVTEALNDIAGSIITITGSTDSGEKGLFGLNLKQETEMIFCLTEKENVEAVFEKIIDVGELETFASGMCISMPIDKIYRSPVLKAATGVTDLPPETKE